MKTFVDANVLLETLLEGRIKSELAESTLQNTDQAVISPLVFHLYVHFGMKEKHSLPDLLKDLENYSILPMSSVHVKWAVNNHKDNDFEDALQVACAVLEGCQTFLTFDQDISKNYSRYINVKLLR